MFISNKSNNTIVIDIQHKQFIYSFIYSFNYSSIYIFLLFIMFLSFNPNSLKLLFQVRQKKKHARRLSVKYKITRRGDGLLKNLQSSLSKTTVSNNPLGNMAAVLGANSGAGSFNSITMNNRSYTIKIYSSTCLSNTNVTF